MWLCKSPQEQLPDGGNACTYAKECSRNGHKTVFSGVLEQAFTGSQSQQPVETHLVPQ